jgi:hypothetical protein
VEPSSVLKPHSRLDLIRGWKAAAHAADVAEHDWRVVVSAYARNGGPAPPDAVRQRAATLRQKADMLKQQLGW